MPKAKVAAPPVGMIDSDMEESAENEMMPTPDSNQENKEPVKKPPGRPKNPAAKPRRTKAVSRRMSGGKSKAADKKKATTRRTALKNQENDQQPTDSEEVDDLQEDVPTVVPEKDAQESRETLGDAVDKKKPGPKRGRATGKGKQKANDKTETIKAVEKDGEFEYTPTFTRHAKATENTSADNEIPETQPTFMEIDEPALTADDDADDLIPQSTYRHLSKARSASRQPQSVMLRQRAVSPFDTERAGSDAATRRKLGEMTKKFEALDHRYHQLREVGIKEAEVNYDKLKKQSEERTYISNDLIASLKQELSTAQTIAAQADTLRSAVIATESSLATAQAHIMQLSSALAEAQTENQTLNAKLAASRTAAASIESVSNYTTAKTPGSVAAPKGKTIAPRTIMVGSAEAAATAQVAQLKEDLYSDLTGLILRAVDRQDEADVYDCIQTGRNGTLHFKLAVAIDREGMTGYEETEFTYTPRLDEGRDRMLLEILPDYLSEEITFSRLNAAKFYARVVDTLTRKRDDGL